MDTWEEVIVKLSLLFLYIRGMFYAKIIESGNIMADGGAMFGAVPKRAWIRKCKSDENNLCQLAMRCLLLVSDNRRILVDLGMGDKHIDKVSYYQPHNLKNISDSLLEYGFSENDITDVIITHLHFDHCGYATRKTDSGSVVPSFPKANYWLSSKQWNSFLHPNKLEEDSFFADNIMPVYNEGLLRLVEDDMFMCDGLELRLFDGHTEGQIVVYANTEDGILTFPADLIPTATHVSLEWISAYDISAITSLREKERFLAEAVEKDYTLIYCHDTNVQSSKVKRLNDNYKATEILKCSK